MQSLPPTTPLGNPEDQGPQGLVSIADGILVTTTLAIAEGTGHEHRVVLKLVRDHLSDFEDFGRVAFEVQPFETAGGSQRREVAYLNREQATLAISFMRNIGVVVAFKKSLVKAFFEMERRLREGGQSLMKALNDPAALRGVLLTYTEKVLTLEEKVGVLTPKAEALDRIAKHGEGAMCPTNAAKALQVERNKLFGWLQANGWIYRRHGNKNWLGYHDKVKAGYLQHKVHPYTDADGEERVNEQLLITAKGLAKLAQVFQGEAA